MAGARCAPGATRETGTLRGTIPILLLVATLGACAPAAPDEAPGAHEEARTGSAAEGEPHEPGLEVVARGRELVRVDGRAALTVATLDGDEGSFEHVTVRPGDHEVDTVLALTRSGDRYELRYLVIDDDGPGDLYGFPWRLQIDEDVSDHAPAPPLPVWAPDGSAVAWLEWDASGTRLRTVGWLDHGHATNPSDETGTYRLAQVPVGTQLRRWETGGRAPTDRPSLLVGDDGEVEWHIELDPHDRAVAMPVA